MTNLPAGWTLVALGDVADTQLGKMLSKKSKTGVGTRPYLRNKNVQWGRFDLSDVPTMDFTDAEYDKFRLQAGDLLVCEGGEVGRAAIWRDQLDGGCAYQKALHRVRVGNRLMPEFLLHLLRFYGYTNFFDPYVTGSTIKHLPQEDLRVLPLPLPPLEEQRRIVAEVEEQFSRLDAAEESVLRGRRGLASLRPQAVAVAFNHDWPWTTLGEIAEVVGGVTKDAKRQNDPSFVEVPYLRVANVQRGFLDLAEVTTIRVPPDKAKSLSLEPGDVLFNEGGDRDKLGRGWVWSGEIEGCIHQNHVFRARPTADFDPKFISWHGNTFGRSWFETHGRQTTNLASLNMTTLKKFPVPCPPRPVQEQVVAEIEAQTSVIDSLDRAADLTLRRSAALRRAILNRAFRGELVSSVIREDQHE